MTRLVYACCRESYLAGDCDGTVVHALIKGCDLPHDTIPNMLLAVLWASQANTAPAAFWAIAFLLLPENRSIQNQIVDLMGTRLETGDNGTNHKVQQHGSMVGLSRVVQERLLSTSRDRSSLPALCVLEAVRLRSPSIDVRVAARDLILHKDQTNTTTKMNLSTTETNDTMLTIQRGTVVAISPYASHLDARLFSPDPLKYNPYRPAMVLNDSRVLHGAVVGVGGLAGLAFGGGKYRCPGRSFAGSCFVLNSN